MNDSIIKHGEYNIVSFNELTLEEYRETVELSLCHKRGALLSRESYYINYKRAKSNIEENIKLYDYCNDNSLSKFITEFEDTCFYWYARSMRDNITSYSELPFIAERDLHCGAYISNHIFNVNDNSFKFEIRYNGNSAEYFANQIQKLLNKRLTPNELMDCFWVVTNKAVTFNMDTRDLNGNINGFKEIKKVSDAMPFFNVVLPSLQSYLYRLSKVH